MIYKLLVNLSEVTTPFLFFIADYEEAETLEDVRDGLHVMRTLLQMGRYKQACDAYSGDLNQALLFNLEAHAEILSLLRPFFPQGWAKLPVGKETYDGLFLANEAGNALYSVGDSNEALAAYSASLLAALRQENMGRCQLYLQNISRVLAFENRLARQEHILSLVLDLSAQYGYWVDLFTARLHSFLQLAVMGKWMDAEKMWQLLDPMDRSLPRNEYRPGWAEYYYAVFRWLRMSLREEDLTHAEQLANAGKDRLVIRSLHSLRGQWHMEQGQWALAAESLHEAVRMAREVGQTDAESEALLTLARFHLGKLSGPRQEAERLAKARKPSHRALAWLWLAIGDHDEAKKHALAAYEWAWADGEPYVRRYELNKARALLEQLGAEIPDLPPYDPAKDEKLPWEDEVAAAIEKLRAEKEAEKASVPGGGEDGSA